MGENVTEAPTDVQTPDPDRMRTPPGLARRVVWLAACTALGAAIAAAGNETRESAYWVLAIPLAIALGWLRMADPSQCEPARREGQ